MLTHGGFGVAVDVEGVRDLLPAALTVPNAQPHRRLGPGRRPGGGLGHADLGSDTKAKHDEEMMMMNHEGDVMCWCDSLWMLQPVVSH